MQLETLFSEAEVQERIDALATRLYRDYADCPLSIVCITEGARRFTEAIVERLTARNVTPQVHEIRASRSDGTELGAVQVEAFDPSSVEERDTLIVDDVIDGGATLAAVREIVAMGEPRSLSVAVLVDKKEHRTHAVKVDYVGFEVESGWVVGFGMDLDGELRDLDEIAVVTDRD